MTISHQPRTATASSSNVMTTDSARSSSTESSSSSKSPGSFPVFDDEEEATSLDTSPEPSPGREDAVYALFGESKPKDASERVGHRTSHSGDYRAAASSGGASYVDPPRPPWPRSLKLMSALFTDVSSYMTSSSRDKGKARAPPEPTSTVTPTTSLIFPFARPYSLPSAASPPDALPRCDEPQEPTSMREDLAVPSSSSTSWIDRSSSASLPLPTQIPYHVLPRAAVSPEMVREGEVWGAGSQRDANQRPHAVYGTASILERPHISTHDSNGSTGSTDSSSSLPSAPASPPQSQSPPHPPSPPTQHAPEIPRLGPLPSAASQMAQAQSQPSPPLSPGSAGVAAAIAEMRRVPGGLAASRAEFGVGYFGYQPGAPSHLGRSWSEASSSNSGSSAPTSLAQRQASQPVQSSSQCHPTSIASVLAQQQRLVQMATGGLSATSPPASSTSYGRGLSSTASSPGVAYANASRLHNSFPSNTNYPPPEPPVILPEEDDASSMACDEAASGGLASPRSAGSVGSGYQPPYAPFLCRAPPPADSWIEVETTVGEYRLNVRLPGFKRDGITLATKRRRILHVVADSWEQNGGHFERRISFGYDADLTQVRAEFDGLMLRVSIPRRIPPITSWIGGRR
ncbi:hypothetical protein HGRIS_002748 [Hohenbuehelia grisea]|uniref:SHSP domain-containing protein n=1 Tax=Hohenbuehelia grisea TaxID=104357 RepID=A0ABR3JMN2_9AGAR